MKDILVDNDIATNFFANPLEPEYKKFINWLIEVGCLVVCNRLVNQYHATCQHSPSPLNIIVIIDKLIRDGRYVKKENSELKAFRIPKRISNRLRSNQRDCDILKTVLLSYRKYAISGDRNLRYDINNYPGYSASAVSRPQDISYA